jgi:hypothetical protein
MDQIAQAETVAMEAQIRSPVQRQVTVEAVVVVTISSEAEAQAESGEVETVHREALEKAVWLILVVAAVAAVEMVQEIKLAATVVLES